ncbi:ester cyclase [Saccharomonospora piscinae]|uniref:ester cyclase n=1 Tax=Saccharomonospora piscinae TaxID=687388 RepID=UPI000465A7F2|nr:ester cyclase [Saccharomonospora piscinae]
MTPEERKDLVRRTITAIINEGDVDACADMYASRCTFHYPNFSVEGVDGYRQFMRDMRQANPDLHCDIHDILVDGDLLAARWTMGGTAHGEFRGIPGTGKSWVISGMQLLKWDDDRVVEEWGSFDLFGQLQQLGVIPEIAEEQQR